MGTDIHIFREVKMANRWECCEPIEPIIQNSGVTYQIKEFDFGRVYALFSLLSGVRGMAIDMVDAYPKGMPSDIDDKLKNRINDTFDDTYDYGMSYVSYNEIEEFIDKWRKKIIELGNLPEDFIDDDGYTDIALFDEGLYKNDVDKRIELYLKIFDRNILIKFLQSLNENPKSEQYISEVNIKDIPSKNKRIVFYYS